MQNMHKIQSQSNNNTVGRIGILPITYRCIVTWIKLSVHIRPGKKGFI